MAAYPGEGYNMSNYGKKKYSPEQKKEQWRESVDRTRKINQQHAATIKATEIANVDTSLKLNYFNNSKTYPGKSAYDHTFGFTAGYNPKLKRDDMQHTQGLEIHDEESTKAVPVLSSSVYGQRPPLEVKDNSHVRVGSVQRDFFRNRGINVS